MIMELQVGNIIMEKLTIFGLNHMYNERIASRIFVERVHNQNNENGEKRYSPMISIQFGTNAIISKFIVT